MVCHSGAASRLERSRPPPPWNPTASPGFRHELCIRSAVVSRMADTMLRVISTRFFFSSGFHPVTLTCRNEFALLEAWKPPSHRVPPRLQLGAYHR